RARDRERAARCAARGRRGARGARAGSRARRRGRAARRDALQDARRARRLRGRARAFDRPRGEPGALIHLHPRSGAGPRRPRPRGGRAVRLVTTRPGTLVLVTGTGTGVGKTWWAAATVRRLRAAHVRALARKPVQSGEPGTPTDADVLAAASGEDAASVCRPD